MRRFFSIVAFILFAFFLASLDIAFFPALTQYFSYVNIIFTTSCYFMVVVSKRLSLLLFVVSTVLSGLMGASVIIIPLLSGLVALVLIDFLFEKFFTNRSYYTLLTLGLIGWFAYYVLFGTLVFLLALATNKIYLPQISLGWSTGIFFGAIVLVCILSLFYMFTTFLSKKFKSYFIITD